MESDLSKLALTSFNSILLNLIEFTAAYKLIAMVTMEHTQSKHTAEQGLSNNFEPK
jgi:hypothetical protein